MIDTHSPATHRWTQPPTDAELPTQPQPPPHHSPQQNKKEKRVKARWVGGVDRRQGLRREPVACVGSVGVGWQQWEEVERELRELRERDRER